MMPAYFDTLEDDPLENVLRFLSSTPASPKWYSKMPVRAAEVLFAFPGPLGDVFRARFATVSLHPRGEKKRFANNGMEEQACVSFDDYTFATLPDACMALVAANIERLSIMDNPGSYFWPNGALQHHNFRFRRWVSTATPALTHLSVRGVKDDHFRLLLNAKNDSLTSLKLAGTASSNEHLDIVKDVFRNVPAFRLRKLEIKRTTTRDLPADFWKITGASLTHLTFTIAIERASQLGDITSEYLPSLTHLSLISSRTVRPLHAILMSFGKKLQYVRAQFSGLGHAGLEEVVEACPNAELHFLEDKPSVMLYKKLGFRAPVLKLGGAVVMPDDIGFFDTYASLREITFNIKDEQRIIDWLRILLHAPKENLRNVSVSSKMSAHCGELLHCIAANVASLENISLLCTSLPVEEFSALTGANPGLRSIVLQVEQAPRAEEDLLPLLHAYDINGFGYATKELRVQLSDKKDTPDWNIETIVRLRDACFKIRRRFSSIHMLGIDFLS